MKIFTLEEVKNEFIGSKGSKKRLKYEKELKEEMMLKKDSKVILENRGKKEFGTVQRKWRRKEIIYYNILTERGSVLEGVTTNSEFPCYINEELSLKYNLKNDKN